MKIEYTMLHVEKGEEMPIVFTEETTSLFVATVIKSLTDNGYIVSNVEFKE